MATIPTVVPTVVGRRQTGSGADLTAVAEGLGNLGAGLEQQEKNQRITQFKDMNNRYLQRRAELMKAQEAKQGQDYINSAEAYHDSLATLEGEMLSETDDPRLKAMFSDWAGGKRASEKQRVTLKGVKYKQKIDANIELSRIATTTDDYALTGENPLAAEDAVTRATEDWLDYQGELSPTTRNRVIKENLQNLHDTRATALYEQGLSAETMAYIEEHGDKMSPLKRADLLGAAKDYGETENAYNFVNAIWDNTDLDIEQKRDEIEQSDLTAEEKIKASAELQRRWSQQNQEKNVREEEALGTLNQEIANGASIQDLQLNHPAEWAVALRRDGALNNFQAAIANRELGMRHPPISEDGLMISLRKQANTDANSFMQHLPVNMESRLSSKDFEVFMKLRDQVQKRASQEDLDRGIYNAADDILGEMYNRVGEFRWRDKSISAGHEENVRQGVLSDEMERRVNEWKQSHDGKNPTVPEMTDMARKVVQIFDERGASFFEDDQYAAEIRLMPQEEADEFRVDYEELDKDRKKYIEQTILKEKWEIENFTTKDVERLHLYDSIGRDDWSIELLERLRKEDGNPKKGSGSVSLGPDESYDVANTLQIIRRAHAAGAGAPGSSPEDLARRDWWLANYAPPVPRAKPDRTPAEHMATMAQQAHEMRGEGGVPEVEPPLPAVNPQHKQFKMQKYRDALYNIEAENKMTAGSSTGAKGPYQFVGTTWWSLYKDGKIPSLPAGLSRKDALHARHTNWEANNEALQALILEANVNLTRKGYEPNELNTYIYHNLGPKYAYRVVGAADDVKIRDLMPMDERKKNPRWYINGGSTVGEIKATIKKAMSAGAEATEDRRNKAPKPREKPSR